MKQEVARINKEQFAGYADWRLPSMEEALSLLESEKGQRPVFTPCFSDEQPFVFVSHRQETRWTMVCRLQARAGVLVVWSNSQSQICEGVLDSEKSNNNEKMAPESEAAYCQERWHEKLCRALPKPDVRH